MLGAVQFFYMISLQIGMMLPYNNSPDSSLLKVKEPPVFRRFSERSRHG